MKPNKVPSSIMFSRASLFHRIQNRGTAMTDGPWRSSKAFFVLRHGTCESVGASADVRRESHSFDDGKRYREARGSTSGRTEGDPIREGFVEPSHVGTSKRGANGPLFCRRLHLGTKRLTMNTNVISPDRAHRR